MDKVQNNENSNEINIKFQIDEFDFEEFELKPVTKGLGFHKDQRKRPVFNTVPQHELSTGRIQSHERRPQVHSPERSVHSGLEAFYSKPMPEPKKVASKIEKKKYKAATLGEQFLAWILDLVLISFLCALTFYVFSLASGIELLKLYSSVSELDRALYLTIYFSLYYLTYFTILDLDASLGKKVFGVKLVGIGKKPLRPRDTFVRSLVSLLSMIALGFPMLMDFQGKLSETRLVKSKK